MFLIYLVKFLEGYFFLILLLKLKKGSLFPSNLPNHPLKDLFQFLSTNKRKAKLLNMKIQCKAKPDVSYFLQIDPISSPIVCVFFMLV